MSRPINRQSRSVGNLGDVLKHAALVRLATELGPGLRFVDTHTYLLHAPFADRALWEDTVATRMAAHPAYARYVALERASEARIGRYRCSSGLMRDVLGPDPEMVLGEANPTTRAELRGQVGGEGLVRVSVCEDAVSALQRASRSDAGAPLLVHVDPFALTPELWAALSRPLDDLVAETPEVAMVVYRYTRSAPSAWPPAPRRMVGPVAEVRGGPHELAAYSSPELEERVREIAHTLGWRPCM